MNFETALELLKEGNNVVNRQWNGKGMYIQMQRPDNNSMNTLPYIFIVLANGERVPWLASQQDLFSEEWEKEEW